MQKRSGHASLKLFAKVQNHDRREMTDSTIISLRGYTVAEMLDHLRCLDGLSGLVAIAFTDDGDDRIGCEVFVSDMTVERLAYAGAQLARTIGEEI
tara:strand:- start:352 stop:639 length:288 start_codon:yes stop_codon:yes gene_type:complete